VTTTIAKRSKPFQSPSFLVRRRLWTEAVEFPCSRPCGRSDREKVLKEQIKAIERLFTVREVAEASGFSKVKIYNDARAGKIHLTKLGRSTRIRESEYARWIGAAAK